MPGEVVALTHLLQLLEGGLTHLLGDFSLQALHGEAVFLQLVVCHRLRHALVREVVRTVAFPALLLAIGKRRLHFA